jgi:exopolyphosphatase/pppGpp-phosphohydrolase
MGAARSYLASYLQKIPIPEPPKTLIVTGSSASSLLKLAKHAFKLDAQSELLTYDDLSRCQGLLFALPAEEIAQRFDQSLKRARVLPGGALIIQAVMEFMRINEIHVGSHGVREGVLLAYSQYSERWLDEVNNIASEHKDSPTK